VTRRCVSIGRTPSVIPGLSAAKNPGPRCAPLAPDAAVGGRSGPLGPGFRCAAPG
jgi:hypothetical protein